MPRSFRRPHNRIARKFVPVRQRVVAESQTGRLLAQTVILNAGIDKCRGAVIVYGATRPAAARVYRFHLRRQGDRSVAPVNQVMADGVAPVWRPPASLERVVLIKKVVFAPPFDHPVGVIEPSSRWGEVTHRAVRIGGKGAAFGEGVLEPRLRFSMGHSATQKPRQISPSRANLSHLMTRCSR